MTIARIIARNPRTIIQCMPQASVREAARLLAEHRIGALPVVSGDQVLGIFSERDLLYCIARHDDGAQVLDRPVREVMTAPAISVTPATDALDALALMTERRIRHLPVMDGAGAEARLVAFISIGDIVKFRLDLMESEAEALRDYIRTA